MHNKVLDIQIKSWQIALLGTIPNIIILLLVACGFLVIRDHDVAYGYLFGFIALVGLIMVILPTYVSRVVKTISENLVPL